MPAGSRSRMISARIGYSVRSGSARTAGSSRTISNSASPGRRASSSRTRSTWRLPRKDAAVEIDRHLGGDDVGAVPAADDRRRRHVVEQRIERRAVLPEEVEQAVGERGIEDRPQGESLVQRQRARHCVEHRANHGRDVDGKAPLLERSQHAADLSGRGPSNDGRWMPARSANRCANETALLLGDLDRIERPSSGPLGESAELAERVADAVEVIGVLLDEVLRTELAACLLVAREREDQIARRLEPLGRDTKEGAEHHRDAALHVEGAPTPDLAVDELGVERRMCPLSRIRRHDVEVAVEQERRRRASARKARDRGSGVQVRGQPRAARCHALAAGRPRTRHNLVRRREDSTYRSE